MRIFVAGASGILGRALLPLLRGHQVAGMTRSQPGLVEALGAEPVVADAYDRDAVTAALTRARPDVVVDLLTDLAGRDFEANNRIRREATPILVAAAVASGARRLVIESISFEVPERAARAREAMEQAALASGLDTAIVRLGRLWGPGTWDEERPDDPDAVSVDEAALTLRNAIFGPGGARDAAG